MFLWFRTLLRASCNLCRNFMSGEKKGHFPLQWLSPASAALAALALPPNHSMNCPSHILSTTSPRNPPQTVALLEYTDTQKTLQHPIPRFAMINNEFGVFAILFCLGMLAWWWHWHERNSSRPVTRRRKEICFPDFGSPGTRLREEMQDALCIQKESFGKCLYFLAPGF